MRFITVSLVVCLLSAATFAMVDLDTLSAKKTAGYYLMPASDGSSFSSGLTYAQKINERSKLEAVFTFYKSPYLLTKNVSQGLLLYNFRLIELGPIGLSTLTGLGLMYSPAVGGGLVGSVGGVLSAQVLQNLKLGFPVLISIFNDGIIATVVPEVNFAFLNNYSFFGGFRIDADMMSSSFSNNNFAGKINLYGVFGVRSAI